MRQKPITKIIIVSSEKEKKLKWAKAVFPELKGWSYNPAKAFIYTTTLKDKTKLFIVNKRTATLKQLFDEKESGRGDK